MPQLRLSGYAGVMTDGDERVPDAVRAVCDFVNTAEPQTGEEQLTDPERLRDWLRARDLLGPGGTLTPADLRRALTIREGLRVALQAHADHPLAEDALAPLDAALAGTPLLLQIDTAGRRRLAPPNDDPLGGLVALLDRAAGTEGWERLKVCARESCRWAYYDTSRNRSGRWCSMAGCGNQVKMRRAYATRRRRAASA
jgi:predicted RNA-binding Zn ribbon-like protein